MPKVPKYATDPLHSFLTYWKECFQLLHSSMKGISVLRAMPNAMKVLKDVGDDYPDEEIEDVKTNAEFAEKECASGFPLLHAHTLVGVWGAFESAIEDMCVGILLNEPILLQSGAFAKMRIPLAEFELLEKDERMRLLLSELLRSPGNFKRQGLGPSEVWLDSFDLTCDLKPEHQRSIKEIHHLRNVIVHRGSFVDRRLVRECPWMGLKIGDKVIVEHQALARYGSALCEFVVALVHGLAKKYGVHIRPDWNREGDSNIRDTHGSQDHEERQNQSADVLRAALIPSENQSS